MSHPYTTGCPCGECDEFRKMNRTIDDLQRASGLREYTVPSEPGGLDDCEYCKARECPVHKVWDQSQPLAVPAAAVSIPVDRETVEALEMALRGLCALTLKARSTATIAYYSSLMGKVTTIHQMLLDAAKLSGIKLD